LGIDPKEESFKDPRSYTTDLSAIIKVALLLVIQRSLQAVEDGTLDYPGISLEQMQSPFITFEGTAPMS